MENKKEFNNQLLLNLLVMISKANQLVVGLMDYNNNLELQKELWTPEDYKNVQEDISKIITSLFAKIKESEQAREETTDNETMRENGTDDSDL